MVDNDLKLMGCALQLQWLWLQRSDPTKQWASMLMYEDVATLAFFRASVVVTVRNDTSTLFWEERWLEGQGIQELAPDLLAAVPARRRHKRTV
jgi:hypothetical protein